MTLRDAWSLPRSTSSLTQDWLSASRAYRTATTDEQRAAVMLRAQSLAERRASGEQSDLDEMFHDIAQVYNAWIASVQEALKLLGPPLLEIQKSLAQSFKASMELHHREQVATRAQAVRLAKTRVRR